MDRVRARAVLTRVLAFVKGLAILLGVVVVATVIFMAVSAITALAGRDAWYDNHEFDKIEVEFDANPEAFSDAADHVYGLVAANPGAEKIYWRYGRVCITMPGADMVCTDTDDADVAVFEPLPGADGVIYMGHDPERLYFKFNHNYPPLIYVMYAPGDSNPEGFAKQQGFSRFRAINEDWSFLGQIYDTEKSDAQWG